MQAVLEGCTKRAWPIQPFSPLLKNCKYGTFYHGCMEVELFWGQMSLFEVFKNSRYQNLLIKSLSKWIKVDMMSGSFQKPLIGSLFFSFNLNLFFEYETIVRSSTYSFGHSDPGPSSVNTLPLIHGLGGYIITCHTHFSQITPKNIPKYNFFQELKLGQCFIANQIQFDYGRHFEVQADLNLRNHIFPF